MDRIRNVLVILREQFWIIPALMTLTASALAYGLLKHGNALVGAEAANSWWLYSGDAATALTVLGSLLTGLMTMISLVISIAFVILTLAANQLGPRLVPTFLADRKIQFVIGLLFGTTLYVLLVLRSVNGSGAADSVPSLAVTVGSALAILCLFALLYYTHKVARFTIADTIIDALAARVRNDLRAIVGDGARNRARAEDDADDLSAPTGAVALGRCGYIQRIDYRSLVTMAQRAGVVLHVRIRPGHYTLERTPHVFIHRTALPIGAENAIRAAFKIGSERKPVQDAEYGVERLVEIAIRALSPGINDLFTALAAVDRIGMVLERALSRTKLARILRDSDGSARVIADRGDDAGLLDAAFNSIRRAAARHPEILIRIADTLRALAPILDRASTTAAIRGQLDKLAETARNAGLTCSDQTATLARIELARHALGGDTSTT